MTDLEKIQHLTYVNAAIVLCSPGTSRPEQVHEVLEKAGCDRHIAQAFIFDYCNSSRAVAGILVWAQKAGLLP